MGLLNFLTGSNAAKIIDGASNGIDKLIYTNEEKAEAHKQLLQLSIESVKVRLNLSSITRRFLAWVIMGVYLLFILTGGFMVVLGNQKGRILIDLLSETSLGTLAVAVGTTYFGGYSVNNIMKTMKNKKDEK